jgi:hypothetical protein
MKIFMFALVVVLAFACVALAQIDSVTLGGYVMVKGPDKDSSGFVNRWSVAKAKVYVDGLCFQSQYNLANNTMVEAEGVITRNFGQSILTICAGRTFTATGQITPSPKGLTTEWWHEVFMNYTFIEDGVGLGFNHAGLNAYLVRGSEWSAAATFHGFQALWQQDHAATVAYEGMWYGWYRPFLGVTFFQDGKKDQYCLLNTVLITPTLQFYWGGDAGRVEEGRFGGCWDITPHVRLKAAYTVKAERVFTEIVCHF